MTKAVKRSTCVSSSGSNGENVNHLPAFRLALSCQSHEGGNLNEGVNVLLGYGWGGGGAQEQICLKWGGMV